MLRNWIEHLSIGVGRSHLERIALQVLTGALVWLASPGLGEQFWLAGCALAPFFLSLRGVAGVRAALWGLSGGAWYIIPGKWDTFATAVAAMGQTPWLHALTTGLFFALYCLPFTLFAVIWVSLGDRRFSRSGPWLSGFGFAALIVFVPSIFPYTPVVMVSAQPWLIQLAELGGEPLLLGLLLTINLGVAQIFWSTHKPFRGALPAIFLPLGLVLGYSAYVLPQWQTPAVQSLSVLALQAQWPRLSKDRLLLRDTARNRPLSAVELTRAGLRGAPHCELVVWPESARAPTLPDHVCERAAELAHELKVPILASCHDRDSNGMFFAARLYSPAGGISEHRKSRLVPLYETHPTLAGSGLQQGDGLSVMNALGLARFAPAICYEIHFRQDLRAAVLEGAQLLTHMANFAVFGHQQISHWDLAMTRIRAVELRRSIIRSVNAGVAGMIDASGAWTPAGPEGTSLATCYKTPLNKQLSVYARHGDSLFWTLLSLFLGLSIWRRPTRQSG